MILILHNIRSVHNVGSIFRTADAAGVSSIILSGYSPAPIDRFGRARSDFTKVSLGAEKTVPWVYTQTLGPTLKKLRAAGCFVAAIEQDPRSQNLFDFSFPPHLSIEKVALVLGNEVRGVSASVLEKCDVILEIPMHGTKESLNVSVTAGIALFTLRNRVRQTL
ncbi:MAG: rRNA (guanosine2251-2-O)-methyltransferase [Patescibacteria group bacterium]|nr:rRNA (guanosine2251-2-O)-methyltransferase [Patescibacteria group bacterium]